MRSFFRRFHTILCAFLITAFSVACSIHLSSLAQSSS
jgi:hypothetical protein